MLKLFGNSGPQPARSAHIGRVFRVGHYKLAVEDVIAEGGFGVVYIVRTPEGQQYALKRIAVNNQADLYLCKQEIAITKALSECKHSVKFIDAFITPLSTEVNEVLLLLRFYPGKLVDLMNHRMKDGLTELEVLKIFTDVCQAVARLHHRTKPIMHRDIKVENVLYDDDEDFVLCDYGSCSIDSLDPQKMGYTVCEEQIERFTTLAYRAPEMIDLYSGKVITTKCDIWALGCMLYKLCFFTTPFGDQRLAILSGSLTIPASSKYSESLHALMRYMLESDPALRPNIYQVCEAAFTMRKLGNPVPNVFRSPPPPSSLPHVPRAASTDTTATPAPISSQQLRSNLRTHNRPSAVAAVASQVSTTISSRERPRSQLHLTAGLPVAGSISPSNHRKMQNKDNPSKDNNTDEFGCVPFAEAAPISSSSTTPVNYTISSSNTTPVNYTITTSLEDSSGSIAAASDEIRTDLFGAKLFTHNSASEIDAFGSQPFTNSPSELKNPEPVVIDMFGSTPFVSTQSQ